MKAFLDETIGRYFQTTLSNTSQSNKWDESRFANSKYPTLETIFYLESKIFGNQSIPGNNQIQRIILIS
jgi:hypothetical protein